MKKEARVVCNPMTLINGNESVSDTRDSLRSVFAVKVNNKELKKIFYCKSISSEVL